MSRDVTVTVATRNIHVTLPAGIPGPHGGVNTVTSVNAIHGSDIVGDGLTRNFTVVHSSGYLFPPCVVFDAVSGDEVFPAIKRVTTTSMLVSFDVAPASQKTYTVTVA